MPSTKTNEQTGCNSVRRRGRLRRARTALKRDGTSVRMWPIFHLRAVAMKTAVITGGNTGIGFETAVELVRREFRTIIACRDAEKGKAAVQQIKELFPAAQVEARSLDLASFSSIREFGNNMVNERTDIDVLVNNAGVMACPKMLTKDGHELQIGTNHFGHALLTSLLYPLLKHEREARIVVVSSEGHKFLGTADFSDINSEKSYRKWEAYGRSKTANILFTLELAKRIPESDNVTVNACHPGVVATELGRYLLPPMLSFLRGPMQWLSSGLLKTPAQGAATSVYLATSPEMTGITGKYFSNCKEIKARAECYDQSLAESVWDVTNSTTGSQWEF